MLGHSAFFFVVFGAVVEHGFDAAYASAALHHLFVVFRGEVMIVGYLLFFNVQL